MIGAIWASFRRLPLWVQVWVAGILVPVNAAAILFVGQPKGALIAILAIGGMAPNLGTMVYDRGFSRLMALPHLVVWTPLVVILAAMLLGEDPPGGAFGTYLWVLLAVDAVSLGFDYPDFRRWWKGARDPA